MSEPRKPPAIQIEATVEDKPDPPATPPPEPTSAQKVRMRAHQICPKCRIKPFTLCWSCRRTVGALNREWNAALHAAAQTIPVGCLADIYMNQDHRRRILRLSRE